MSDRGNLTSARRSWAGKASRAKRREAIQTTCHKCGKKDKTGLMDGLCAACFYTNPTQTQTAGPVTATNPMNQVQTTTAAMSTTAELLTAYNAITAYNTQEGKDLARLIIQGDTSGKLPTKREQIVMEDCEGEYFIPAILAVKPGKLAPAQAVAPLASRDTLRPAMNCVYYDTTRAAVVVTCGHVLMSFPCGPLAPASTLLHPVTLEPLKVGDVVNKQVMSKDAVDTRYPDYVSVIRYPNPNGPAATLDVQSFRNQLAGIARATRFVNLYTGIRARIQHEGQDFYVDAALCDNVLRAMQASGTTRVNLDLSEPNRALQFTDVNDAQKLALIMPVQGTSYGKEIAFCTVLDTAVGQLLTSPASVKRVTVKKPVQPRAVQVLSKEEKKSLAAHVKQYEAADTTEQTRMLTTVREKLAGHMAILWQSYFRYQENHRIHSGRAIEALSLARLGRALLATIAPPTTPAPAETPAPAPAVAYFAAYTENETTRSQVGTYGSHREAMQAAKEAAKSDHKRMPGQSFAPLVVEVAAPTTSPAAPLPFVLAYEHHETGAAMEYQGFTNLAAAETAAANMRAETKTASYCPRPHAMSRADFEAAERADYAATLAWNGTDWVAPATSPAPTEQPAEQCPVALTHNGATVYHLRKHHDNPASRIPNYHFSLSPDGANEFDVRDLPGYVEPAYAQGQPDGQFYEQQQAEAHRVLRLHVGGTTPTSPVLTLPPVSKDKQLGHRIAPSEATGINKNARTVVFYLDEKREQFPRTAPHRLLRRLLTLLGVTERAHSVHRPRHYALFCIDATNALALRISEEAAQLDNNHGGFTPAHAALIARRELGRNAPAATFAPVAELTPPRMPKRKNLFAALRLAGHRVQVLHQVGKCAVARVFPCEGRAPFYTARFRQHYAEFGHLREAEQALQTLRRLDNAEIRRDNEVLTATDALWQLGLDPACFARFCALHELDVGRSYMRRELRRAITDRRQPKMPVYLSLLNRLTVTNPAA